MDAIETPCVRVCIVEGDSGLCVGCLRTLEEIAAWGRLSPERRREIMDALPVRRARREPPSA